MKYILFSLLALLCISCYSPTDAYDPYCPALAPEWKISPIFSARVVNVSQTDTWLVEQYAGQGAFPIRVYGGEIFCSTKLPEQCSRSGITLDSGRIIVLSIQKWLRSNVLDQRLTFSCTGVVRGLSWPVPSSKDSVRIAAIENNIYRVDAIFQERGWYVPLYKGKQ